MIPLNLRKDYEELPKKRSRRYTGQKNLPIYIDEERLGFH